MKLLSKLRSKKGFTMAEILIVVSIIGILLAVAMPDVLGYYRDLKLTEYDDNARTIFVAAQSRLSGLVAMGEKLDGIGVPAPAVTGSVGTVQYRYVLHDPKNTASEDSLHKILPAGSVDPALQDDKYVIEFDPSTGAVYAVWFWKEDNSNFNYGNHAYQVDGVQYPNEDSSVTSTATGKKARRPYMVGYYGGTSINRLEVNQMPIPEVEVINAEELVLTIKFPTDGLPTGVFADVTLSSGGKSVEIIKEGTFTANGDYYSGRVALDTLNDGKYTAKTGTKDLSGDGVGKKFKDWVMTISGGVPAITPGSDIKIEVKVYTNGTGADALIPQRVSCDGVNSLFQSITANSDGSYTANIAYGRHLQNLHDSGITSTTGGIACSGVLANDKIKKAEQTKDINFALVNNTGDANNDVYYWASTYPDNDPSDEDTYMSLHPINNNNLTGYNGQDYEIRNMDTSRYKYGGLFSCIAVGGTYANINIINPHVHLDKDASDVSDPNTWKDPDGDTASMFAGALVGWVRIDTGTLKISNCHVYNDYRKGDDPIGVGYMLGKETPEDYNKALGLSEPVTGPFNMNGFMLYDKDGIVASDPLKADKLYAKRLLGLPHIGAPVKGSISGGMVGFVESGNIEIDNSFASVINIGAKYAGGMIGVANGTVEINNSYSAGFTYGNREVGGLIGLVDVQTPSITIDNCYAAGEIMCGYIKGFMGAGLFHYKDEENATTLNTSQINVTNSYAAVRYTGDGADGLPKGDDYLLGITKQSVVGFIYGTFKGDSDNFYISQSGISYGYDSPGGTEKPAPGDKYVDKGTPSANGTSSDANKLKTDLTGWKENGATYPYRLLNELKDVKSLTIPYPYPMLKTLTGPVPHYGDWLEEDAATFALAYWERYDTTGADKYGVYGLFPNEGLTASATPINTLLNPTDRTGKNYAIADGYGVLVKRDGTADTSAPSVTINSTLIDFATSGTIIKNIDVNGAAYDLYVLPYTVPATAPTAYYTEINVNGKDFYYNPDFACEVFEKQDGVAIPTVPQAKEEVNGKGGTEDVPANGVVIRTARQLANLVTYTTDTGTLGTAAKSWKYHQFLDIDYSQYTGAATGTTGTFKTGTSSTDTQAPALLSGGSYDGNNFKIVNLYLSTSGTDTVSSLFATVENDPAAGIPALQEITLVNVKTDDTATVAAGLVANLTNATVSNCGIYVDHNLAEPALADDNTAYTTFTVTGTGIAGGLVGKVEGTSVLTGSFAAVQVTGGTTAGGLVGQFTGNATVTSCYAGGHTESGAYNKDTINVTGTTVGGFAGKIATATTGTTAVTFSDINYSTCSVGKGTDMGLFIGKNESTSIPAPSGDDAIYATGTAFDKDGNQTTAVDESAYLTTGNAIPRGHLTVDETYPYDDTLKDLAYPYDTNLDEHHGDWVTFPMAANIEKYQIGTTTEYGAYAASVNAAGDVEVTLNTLKSKAALGTGYVVDDFYRILSPQELTGAALKYTVDTGTSTDLELDNTTFTGGKAEFDGQTYYVYKFDTTGWTTTSADYYHILTLGNYTFYINPDFGLEAYAAASATTLTKPFSKPEAAGKKDGTVATLDDLTTGKDATGVVIRSARQLANIQAYTNNTTTAISDAAKTWTYDQLLNVDFDPTNGYMGTGLTLGKEQSGPRLAPAKLSSGTYNGHDHTISNLYLGAGAKVDDFAGLFGYVGSGTVSHVLLVNVDVKGDDTIIGNALAVGGLVGQLNGGTVDSCGIYVSEAGNYSNFTVSGSGKNGVGGLIGQIYNIGASTVKNSFAAVMVKGEAAAAAVPENSVGGLIGQINVTSANISNCYVGGYVDATDKNYDKAPVNVSGNNNVGGFVGSVTGTVTFAGINYATASVGGPDEGKLGLFAGAGAITKPTDPDDKLYAVAKAFKTGATTTVVAPRDESAYLVSVPAATTTVTTTVPYNQAGDYPYESGQTTHHGDWIGLTKGVYFDVVDGTTGYYGNGENGGGLSGATGLVARPTDTVTYATDDGYVFLSKEDMGDKVALGINGAGFTMDKEALSSEIDGYKYAYKVPADALNTMPTDAYYFTASVNGQFFAANFAFAGEIFDYGRIAEANYDKPAEKKDLTTADSDVAIRSPRQLANAGIWTSRSEASGAIARGLGYEQLLDINYDKYIAANKAKMPAIYQENKDNKNKEILYNQVPITLSGNSASYEGHGYEIRGVLPGYMIDYDGTNTFALNGFFGKVKDANVSNVNLINARVVGYSGNKAVAQLDETAVGTISLPGSPIAPIAGETTYVLDVSSLNTRDYGGDGTGTGTGKQNADQGIKAGTDSYFTLYWKRSGTGSSVKDDVPATWTNSSDESFTMNKRIQWGGKSSKDSNKEAASVWFTTNGSATVKVWWMQSKKGDGTLNELNLYKSNGSKVTGVTNSDDKLNQPCFDVFEINGSGTYFLGDTTNNGCYLYRVEVTEPAISGVDKNNPTPSTGSSGPVVPPDPPVTGENGVNEALLAKGILAPMGHGFNIDPSAKVRVGAVAGIIDSATVINSGAYVEANETATDPDHDTADEAYEYFIVKNEITGSDDMVGGFAGNVAGTTVERCFSAVKVIGVRNAGGFAGQLGGTTTVKDCYVGGHTVKGTYLKINDTLKNSEYYVNVSTTATDKLAYTGGFVGKVNGDDVTFSGINYTTASVGMAYNTVGDGKEKDTTISTIGQFAGTGTPKTDTTTTTELYASGTIFRKVADASKVETEDKNQYESFPQGTAAGFKSKEYKDEDGKDTKDDFFPVRNDEETYLTQAALVGNPQTTRAETTRYDTTLGNNYPYPTAASQTVHHGDWTERFQFIYYEVYDYNYIGDNVKKINTLTTKEKIGNVIGFYAVLRGDGTTNRVVNTLKTDKLVRDSGYMILADSENTGILFTISAFYGDKQNSGKSTYLSTADAINNTDSGLKGMLVDQHDNKIANYLYVIPFEAINLAPSKTYYNSVAINGQPYMLNAQFACEAVNVNLTKTVDGKEVLDYDTIRAKPELKYVEADLTADGKLQFNSDGSVVMKDVTSEFEKGSVLIRNPWNLAGMARLTRAGNDDETAMKNAQGYTFHLLLDVDYGTASDGKPAYANGERIFDGNTNARGKKGTDDEYHQWYSGTKDGMGQVAANLAGGTFEGHGHTIKNIYLGSDRLKDTNVGLFGQLTNGSTVENFVLENVNVNAYGNGKAVVGTVASEVDGDSTIKNVIIKGLTMDFHYKNENFVENNRRNKITIEQVGGVVGKLAYGTVKDVEVSGVTIDFNSTAPGVAGYTPNTEDSSTISIGGAIGEIKAASGDSVSVTNVEVKEPNIKANRGKTLKVGGAIGNIDTSESTGGKAAIEKVYVTDAIINANIGKSNIVGGVIGKADGKADEVGYVAADRGAILISDSGVYLTNAVETDGTGVITADNFNKTYVVSDNTTGDFVGGFVGRTDNYVTVSNCFSAIRVEGKGSVGGFAGHIEGSVIANCYSGGHTKDGTYGTTANVKGGSGNTGGFAGKIEYTDEKSLELKGIIYTTSSVTGTGKVGLFQGGETNRDAVKKAADASGAVVYATGKVLSGDQIDESAYLKTGASVPGNNNTSLVTKNYDPTLDPSYPYANNTTFNGNPTHFGDWEKYSANAAFYWEREGEKYHFYAVLVDSNNEVTEANSLCAERDANRIDAWGYGVFSDNNGVTLSLDGTDLTEDTSDAAKAAMEAVMGADGFGAAKSVVMIAGATAKTDEKTVEVGGATFYVNPAYAKAVEYKNGTAAATLGDTKPYEIRTVQQLKNIGDSNTSSFKQSHDVVFAAGDSHTSITTFKGDYNGAEYRIIDIDKPVFDTLAEGANIHNVIVYAPKGYDSATISGKGGIANSSSGDNVTISDTIVAGFTINGDSVGGLVGEVTGGELTIKNSEATNNLDGSANVGGLVGYVGSSGTLKITNSYAGGTVTGTTSAGGLVGAAATADNVTYENVYSYATVNGATTTYGIGPGTVDPSSVIQEYWDDGIPSGKTASDGEGIKGVGMAQIQFDTRQFNCAVEECLVPDATDGLKNLAQGKSTDDEKYSVFPFAAFVTGADGSNYHYGEVPKAQFVGLFYWEKEIIKYADGREETEYHYYAHGGEIVDGILYGQKVLLDSLCYDHHLNGERASIVESGYGVFNTDPSKSVTVKKNSEAEKDITSLTATPDPIKSNLVSALWPDGAVTDAQVYDLESSTGDAIDQWTLGGVDLGKPIKAYPAFAAAIDQDFGDDNTGSGSYHGMGSIVGKKPLQIRTIGQLMNLTNMKADKYTKYVAISHDIDGKGKTLEPISSEQMMLFDGCGYRILDLDIKPSTGEAALFSSLKSGCEIKNVILYSTNGKGEITSTDSNAAGILASGQKVKIENCVVVGYTITGAKSIGGIVGESTGDNESYIKNCQAIVTLDGTGGATNIGGIAGKFRGSGSNGIIDCYAGGSVVKATSATVGGIAGGVNNGLNITNSYSYMDLLDTGAGNGKVYAIVGDSTNKVTVSDCYYLNEYLPSGAVTTSQGSRLSFADMCAKQGGDIADYVYVPNADDAMDGLTSWGAGAYPFAAKVTVNVRAGVDTGEETGTVMVHYGDWPYSARAAGIAYWEKVGTEYLFKAVWVDYNGDVQTYDKDKDKFCTDYHVDGSGNIEERNEITDSGYVFFTTNKDLTLGELSVDIGSTLLSGSDKSAIIDALNEKLKVKCIDAFTVVSSNGKFTTENPGTVDAYRTVTLTKIDGTTVTKTLYCNPGMSGVADKSFRDTYKEVTEGSTKKEVVDVPSNLYIEIRTVKQLDNIPNDVVKGYHFQQTHDIYGKDYMADSNPIYTGATSFAGTYDGQGYKILDLSMSGADKDVGLFESINAKTCELRNIIMYAPNGATISGTGTRGNDNASSDHFGVGGLVGSISSGTDEAATIENCVVAGYTIKGQQHVGGLIGWGFYGATIKNCAAVNDIECTAGSEYCGAGGILGGYGSNSAGQTSITNCYTGGTITVSGDNASNAVVGGICGKNGNNSDHAKVTNCYTYVDLSKCAKAKVSVISSSENSDNANNYYLNDSARIPNWVHKQGEGKAYDELKSVLSGAGFDTATKSYVTKGKRAGEVEKSVDGYTPMEKQTTTASFPFPEVPINGEYVHYGDWPAKNTATSSSSYPWTDGQIGVILGYSEDNTFGTDSDVVAMMFKNDGTSSVRGTTTGTEIDNYIGLVIGNGLNGLDANLRNHLRVLYYGSSNKYEISSDGKTLTIKDKCTAICSFSSDNLVEDFANETAFGSYNLYGATTTIKNDGGELLVLVYDSGVDANTLNISMDNIIGWVKVSELNAQKNGTGAAGSPGAWEGPSFEAAALPPADPFPLKLKRDKAGE